MGGWGELGGSRRTRDITDRTPEISSTPLAASPPPPRLSPVRRLTPSSDYLEGRLFGGGKAPERRLRVATDITVTRAHVRTYTHTHIRARTQRHTHTHTHVQGAEF